MTTARSIQEEIPENLTNTQKMFLVWNAERLNISLEESLERYFRSWTAIEDGHAGASYRSFNDMSYELFQVFFSDTREEVFNAYTLHSPMHFLRMLAYPDPAWQENDPIIDHLSTYSSVDIIDYGCGLAQKSRSLARNLNVKGIKTKLTLVDIPTLRKDFLLWVAHKENIDTVFLDCTTEKPIPDLPGCDICVAKEVFEHAYDPLLIFDNIHAALRKNGLLVTNIADHKREFMHVSPNLHTLRSRIRRLGYEELRPNELFKRRADSGKPANQT